MSGASQRYADKAANRATHSSASLCNRLTTGLASSTNAWPHDTHRTRHDGTTHTAHAHNGEWYFPKKKKRRPERKGRYLGGRIESVFLLALGLGLVDLVGGGGGLLVPHLLGEGHGALHAPHQLRRRRLLLQFLLLHLSVTIGRRQRIAGGGGVALGRDLADELFDLPEAVAEHVGLVGGHVEALAQASGEHGRELAVEGVQQARLLVLHLPQQMRQQIRALALRVPHIRQLCAPHDTTRHTGGELAKNEEWEECV